jgi:hypothetical protein
MIDGAFGHFLQAADHPQRRRLAAAGRPEHGDKFAVLYFSAKVDDRPGPARKGLGDVFEDDVGLTHRCRVSRRFGHGVDHVPDRLEGHIVERAFAD